MALLFLDGFDKYGGVNSSTASVGQLVLQEWTSITNTNPTLVAPLSSAGQAVLIGSNSGLTKTLATNYGRIIGGVRFSSTLAAAAGIQFYDAASQQCGIAVATTGVIQLRNGV